MHPIPKLPAPLLLLLLLCFTSPQTAPAHYDPATQRWINRDPLEERAGPDLYTFVGNGPLTFVDTDGRERGWTCHNCGRYVVGSPPCPYCSSGPVPYPTTIDEILVACATAGAGAAFEECVLAKLSGPLERLLGKCKNIHCKVSIHPAHHGKKRHLDITCWTSGKKGSQIRWDWELPWEK